MTISTERLKEIIERRSPSLRWGEAEAIAAELLAAREAQSVPIYLPEPNNRLPSLAGKAERDYLRGRNETLKECICTLKKCGICITHVKPGTRMSALVMPEDAAPPAPAVTKLPDFGALTKLIVGRLIDYGTANDDAIADAEVFVYNACRAAMLNHTEQHLDMVQDGYKLVPVEPTEAMLLTLGMTGSFESMIAKYKNMLAVVPDDIDKFVGQVCGNL